MQVRILAVGFIESWREAEEIGWEAKAFFVSLRDDNEISFTPEPSNE